MISIFKHLYEGAGDRANPEPAFAADLCQLSLSILESIGRHVLTGDSSEAFRRRLDAAKGSLQTDPVPERLLETAGLVTATLADHQAAAQDAAIAQAVEVQHIFGMLNHALIVLAEGRDRSVSRLSEIQKSLHQASRIKDIVAMKSALIDAVKSVEEESVQARETVSTELLRLEAEVSKARTLMEARRTPMAGRDRGIEAIVRGAADLAPGQALYVICYLCCRFPAFATRYGAAIADEMLFRMIKERLLPFAAIHACFQWSPCSIVGVAQRPQDLAAIQLEAGNLNQAALVHRIALGNRVAVLTLAPSHLVVQVQPNNPAAVIEQLDIFTGAGR